MQSHYREYAGGVGQAEGFSSAQPPRADKTVLSPSQQKITIN